MTLRPSEVRNNGNVGDKRAVVFERAAKEMLQPCKCKRLVVVPLYNNAVVSCSTSLSLVRATKDVVAYVIVLS